MSFWVNSIPHNPNFLRSWLFPTHLKRKIVIRTTFVICKCFQFAQVENSVTWKELYQYLTMSLQCPAHGFTHVTPHVNILPRFPDHQSKTSVVEQWTFHGAVIVVLLMVKIESEAKTKRRECDSVKMRTGRMVRIWDHELMRPRNMHLICMYGQNSFICIVTGHEV